jgi:hypothetical protein
VSELDEEVDTKIGVYCFELRRGLLREGQRTDIVSTFVWVGGGVVQTVDKDEGDEGGKDKDGSGANGDFMEHKVTKPCSQRVSAQSTDVAEDGPLSAWTVRRPACSSPGIQCSPTRTSVSLGRRFMRSRAVSTLSS